MGAFKTQKLDSKTPAPVGEVARRPTKTPELESERTPGLVQLARIATPAANAGAPEAHAAALADRRLSGPAKADLARQLQQTYGNRYVQRLVDGVSLKRFQAKLTVGPAGDRYEQEADRVAKQVMGKFSASDGAGPQRQVEEDELQMKPLPQRVGVEGGDAGPDIDRTIENVKGHGQPLPKGVRARMEGAFGADFTGVRLHTDSEANELNRAMTARAFTVGRDIFFGKGEYNPAIPSGKEVLAHELTHVVQQNGGQMQRLRPKLIQRDIDQDTVDTLLDRYQKGLLTKEQALSIAKKRDSPDNTGMTYEEFEAMLESTIGAPPKEGESSSSGAKEQKWFDNLPLLFLGNLQPGDILIRKVYTGHKVSKSQMAFKGSFGSKYSVHAALVIDSSTIAEASGHGDKVYAHPITEVEGQFVVHRPTDTVEAEAAVATATWLTDESMGLKYAKTHCVSAFTHSSEWGSSAKKRAKAIEDRDLGALGVKKMMCSEFVSFCFQSKGVEDPAIKLDAKRVAPIILESYLITSEKFKIQGRIDLEPVDLGVLV